MVSVVERRVVHHCVVCGVSGNFPYDARFDGPSCDTCHAMLTIRDDVFRRLHPEHDAAIQAIWRDLHDPARARDVGRRYAEIGYWEAFSDDVPTDDAPTGPDDRVRVDERLKIAIDSEDDDGDEV